MRLGINIAGRVLLFVLASLALPHQGMGDDQLFQPGPIIPAEILLARPGFLALVASDLRDDAFPSDPFAQKAYLSNSTIAQRYASTALRLTAGLYDGDVEAALIAIHPDGGDKLARAWQKGLRDDQLLPVSVRHFYHETLAKVKGVSGI